ncbi:unnamed protein product [Dibothriocephalus latus]|uniref:Uncharacterized protein n=1 Tax=Dibothriocephalus latus TaxID=60516 RepID=A0A3P6TJ68_DIBLA|nr:unnamed protein product [Dibothriocephalus latus]
MLEDLRKEIARDRKVLQNIRQKLATNAINEQDLVVAFVEHTDDGFMDIHLTTKEEENDQIALLEVLEFRKDVGGLKTIVTSVCEQMYLLCYSDGQVQLQQLMFEVDTVNLLDSTAIFSVKLSDVVFSNRRSKLEQPTAAFKVTAVKIAPQRPLIAEKIAFLACDGGRVYKLDLQYYLTAANSNKAPEDTNTLMGSLRWRAHAGPINDLACFRRLNETTGKEDLFLVTGGQDGLAKIFVGSTGVHLGILNQVGRLKYSSVC